MVGLPKRVIHRSSSQHFFESEKLNHGERLPAKTGHGHPPTLRADPLVERDDRAYPRAVDHPQVRQIDNDIVDVFGDQILDDGPEVVRRQGVELTLDGEGRDVRSVGSIADHGGSRGGYDVTRHWGTQSPGTT